jgi:hypothetical protein
MTTWLVNSEDRSDENGDGSVRRDCSVPCEQCDLVGPSNKWMTARRELKSERAAIGTGRNLTSPGVVHVRQSGVGRFMG